MADLNDLQSATAVKLAGAGITGSESYFANVTSDGKLKTEIYPERSDKDAFGRNRISIPNLIDSMHFEQVPHDLLMNSSTTGAATITHSQADSALVLTCGTASGDRAIRQTKRYITYNPGIGYIFTFAINAGAKKTNVSKRWGYFDDLNGAFFEQDGSNLKVITRTNQSGSAVNTVVNQSSWNIDTLDGTGASGITLDETKHNLFIIDCAWHGAGPVRFGVHIGGKIYYCHQIVSGNTLIYPYTRTTVLPLRVELQNTGTTVSSTSINWIGMSSSSENGSTKLIPNYSFSASNALTSKSVSTTMIPLIAIRPKTTFSGITNRIPVMLDSYDIFTSATYLYYQVILNPTLTGAVFNSVNTNSSVEYDVSSTSYTGGTIISEGYTTNTTKGGIQLPSELDQFTVGLNIAGTTSDIILITGQSTSNNNQTYSVIRWNEFQ